MVMITHFSKNIPLLATGLVKKSGLEEIVLDFKKKEKEARVGAYNSLEPKLIFNWYESISPFIYYLNFYKYHAVEKEHENSLEMCLEK